MKRNSVFSKSQLRAFPIAVRKIKLARMLKALQLGLFCYSLNDEVFGFADSHAGIVGSACARNKDKLRAEVAV